MFKELYTLYFRILFNSLKFYDKIISYYLNDICKTVKSMELVFLVDLLVLFIDINFHFCDN